MNNQPVIAIDGPAGSGKSTIARLTAQQSQLQFISSGALYRAVALQADRNKINLLQTSRLVKLAHELPITFITDARGDVHTLLASEDITNEISRPDIGMLASKIALIPALRHEIVKKLRHYGRQGGIIMEGRDIQTVVFPDADIKIFLSASVEERAQRRQQELISQGTNVSFEEILQQVIMRDNQDCQREASPLCAAEDAIIIDTDGRSINEVVSWLLAIIDTWRTFPNLPAMMLASKVKLPVEPHS